MRGFDAGYGAFDATIDPAVLTAAIEGVTVLTKTGIETAAAASEAKRQQEAAKARKHKASVATVAPAVVAPPPPPPAPAVPGWAIALGVVGTVAVVGAILYAPKAPPRRIA